MLTHLTLQDKRGTHGLENLSYQYTGMGGYHRNLDEYIKKHKEVNPGKGGSYANIPGEMLFHYNAQDADATLRVYNELISQSEYQSNPKFRALAEVFFPQLSETIRDMEYAGACIDMGVIERMDKELSAKMAGLLVKMKELPQVRCSLPLTR